MSLNLQKFEGKISAKGKYWKISQYDKNYAIAAGQKYGVSNFLGMILSQKNVDIAEVEKFLAPKIRDYLPDPYLLSDMDKAVARITEVILDKKKIAIYGDYDVDGATASALLARFLDHLGVERIIYIPDRIKEGYGVNTEALKYLKSQGADLVITVDCGILSFEPIEEANKIGLDVVIIDHHLSSEVIPSASAVINPNRIDDKSGLSNLCAAGVAFLVVVALNSNLKKLQYYSNTGGNTSEPSLFYLLDLVALGTVCDVMVLQGINRAYVSQGLKVLAEKKNVGLAAICDVAGVKDSLDVYSLGFMIGPRINAAGRIGDCSLGAKILSETDGYKAQQTAVLLNQLNIERQEIEKRILEEAINNAEKLPKSLPFIMLYSKDWHPGIIGIVAGRIKDMFDKPTAVISLLDNYGKASARSIAGVNIGQVITNAKNEGLILYGGGHKAAAGFTMEASKLDDLYNFFCKSVEKDYALYSNDNFVEANLALRTSSLTIDLANEIEKLAPFGNGNPEPVIIVGNAMIVSTKIYSDKHIGFYFVDKEIGKINGEAVKGIVFNAIGTDLGNALLNNVKKPVSLRGKLRKSYYIGNEKLDFYLEDMICY